MVASQLSHFQTLSIPDRTSAQPCPFEASSRIGLKSARERPLRAMSFPPGRLLLHGFRHPPQRLTVDLNLARLEAEGSRKRDVLDGQLALAKAPAGSNPVARLSPHKPLNWRNHISDAKKSSIMILRRKS
jgi:hypothetical protein